MGNSAKRRADEADPWIVTKGLGWLISAKFGFFFPLVQVNNFLSRQKLFVISQIKLSGMFKYKSDAEH